MKPSENDIVVFTDGASKGNPGAGGWGVVIIHSKSEVIEFGGSAENVGNNQMELKAAVRALEYLSSIPGKIFVYTDSKYVINGVESWLRGWLRNDWKTASGAEVRNIVLWKELNKLLEDRKEKGEIKWCHVPGHSGVMGNERADKIASSFAEKKKLSLFSGKYKDYPRKIDFSKLGDLSSKKPAKKTKGAYSYLSMVDGKIEKHKTWKECEGRVKGSSGAKYKKAMSADQEKEIIQSWTSKN
jgi:ribonuclease HI